MRFLPALALAAVATAALTSGPASAAETCPLLWATYTMPGAPNVMLVFDHDERLLSSNGTKATVFDGSARPVGEIRFSWAGSGPVRAMPGGAVLAFGSDFTWAGMPKSPKDDAPHAIIIPGLLPSDETPPDIWVFSHCQTQKRRSGS